MTQPVASAKCNIDQCESTKNSESGAVIGQSGDVVDGDELRSDAADDILPELSTGALEPLDRHGLVEKVKHGQLGRRGHLASGQQRRKVVGDKRHLEISLVMLELIILGTDMRPWLHVIRGEAGLVGEIRVEADVPSEVHHVDEELLPGRLPSVGARPRDLDRVRLGVLREARRHVGVELAPVLGEEDGAPAAGELVKVGSVGRPVEELGRVPPWPLLGDLHEPGRVEGDGGELREGD